MSDEKVLLYIIAMFIGIILSAYGIGCVFKRDLIFGMLTLLMLGVSSLPIMFIYAVYNE